MQTPLWHILVLAVVQGMTEFLPISSSGHLVVVGSLLSGENSDALDLSDVTVVLHVGTLLSILVFYWRRVVRLVAEDRRLVPLLILGTIPAVVVGLPVKLFFEQILESPFLAGIMLIVTGAVLLLVSFRKPGSVEYERISYRQAFLVGLSQAAALLPGLSRSGMTIATGLSLGLSPRSAATFSFLLAIPAIAGAGLVQTAQLIKDAPGTTPVSSLVLGAVVSFVVGLFCLGWLIRWLERGRLHWFAFWCIPLGIGVIAWKLVT